MGKKNMNSFYFLCIHVLMYAWELHYHFYILPCMMMKLWQSSRASLYAHAIWYSVLRKSWNFKATRSHSAYCTIVKKALMNKFITSTENMHTEKQVGETRVAQSLHTVYYITVDTEVNVPAGLWGCADWRRRLSRFVSVLYALTPLVALLFLSLKPRILTVCEGVSELRCEETVQLRLLCRLSLSFSLSRQYSVSARELPLCSLIERWCSPLLPCGFLLYLV